MDITVKCNVSATILILGSICLSSHAQPPVLTPSLREAVQNVDKLETSMTLDQEEYLPRETVRITVTVRNPTDAPLRIPEPFHQMTGACRIFKKLPAPPGWPVTEKRDTGARFPVWYSDFPTIVLGPGQEISQTATAQDSKAWHQVHIQDDPGEWQMSYQYNSRLHADFRIVRATKLWAISIVHLRPSEHKDEIGRTSMQSDVVPFLAVETLPGEYWLIRGDANPEELSPWPFKEFTLDVMYRQMGSFERIKRLDEPITSLRTELMADDTVQMIGEGATHRQVELRVPSRPVRLPKQR